MRGSYEGWRENEVAELRMLCAAGYTSTLIAERLGKTRSSVCAKASRLGLKLGKIAHHSVVRMTSREVAELPRVNRDPCIMCGVRGDVGCQHTRWAA